MRIAAAALALSFTVAAGSHGCVDPQPPPEVCDNAVDDDEDGLTDCDDSLDCPGWQAENCAEEDRRGPLTRRGWRR